MPAPATGRGGPVSCRRHHAGTRRSGVRGAARDRRIPAIGAAGIALSAFSHGVGQGDQIVLVGTGRQRPGVAHQLPAARRGDPAGVTDAQIPRVRLAHGGQRADDGGRIGIDERQRRHRVMGAPGPAAATGNIHAREAIARSNTGGCRTRAAAERADVQPLRSSAWPIPAVPGVAVAPAVRPAHAVAERCAVRCFRRPCRAGAAARSGSTWRCWRPTSRSSDAGSSG